ncbi:MAG: hypothetical protein AAGF31_02850 [Planctomycetota bacterium]
MMLPLAQAVVSPEQADAVWRLETSWRYAPWLTVLAVIGVVLLVGYCYAKELSPAGRGYRWLLAGLRLTTFALLMVMLSELLLAGARSGRPRFAILLDRSASMGVVDARSASDTPLSPVDDDRDTASAGEEDDQADTLPQSRWQQARERLLDEEAALFERLAADYDLELYTVADQREPVDVGEQGWPATMSDIQVDETAMATRLGDAIEQLVAGSALPAPQGVLVVTDGRVTAGTPLATAAESARRASTPLYLLGVGSEDEPPDVGLSDLLAEEVVFVDDVVSFRATLRTTSSVRGPIRVSLRRQGETTVLAEQTIEPPADGGATPIQLLHRPEQPGVYRYEIAVTSTADELNTGNNSVSHELTVRDQQVRVLLASGGPSYEFRYLKHLLERDSTVELASFLQEADIEYVTADPSAIGRLPLRAAELGEYDVVLLIDLDPRLVARSFWPTLRAFVGDQGGGLALIAGPRYLPGGYRDLADFAALYPADLSGAGVGEAVTSRGFRVAPTPIGLGRAALQLADDAASTSRVWRGLPELYWYAELGPLKPAAQVFAAHPTAASPTGQPAPLIVTQYFGAGQVLVHAVDSTYRWRRRVGDVYFARYWVQTIRALARGRLAASETGVELTVDRRRYELGEPIRLRLRMGSASADQQSLDVLLQPKSGPQQTITLTRSADARGVYQTTLDSLPVGTYEALLAESVTGDGAVTATFEVTPPPGEFARLEMAAAEMQAAAERSRGKFFTLDQADELLAGLPRARRVPIESLPPVELWNRWWMLAAICGCLTTEWILRKRRAML